jgi:H+-transporting ATPase
VLGTQIIATLIAVYGLFMAPLGWKWAGFVWAYALLWALINDRVKLLAYKIFDPVKTEPKPDAKAEAKPDAKGEPKHEAKAESKPEAKTPSDLTPKIAKRAYELYEKRAGNDGTAVKDWKKAEQEIRNDEAKAEPKPEAKADAPKPEAKADEPKTEAKADQPKPEAKADGPKPEAKGKPQPDVSPQLVKRVHEVYEQLGREDVQTVQNFEKAEPELKNNESKK